MTGILKKTISILTLLGCLLQGEVIHDAAWQGDLPLVKTLIINDPTLLEKGDNRNCSALHFACDGGHADVVEYLLSLGVTTDKPDIDGDTALHWAAFAGHQDIIEKLITHGFNIDAVNNSGIQPIHYAVKNAHAAVVDMLVERGSVIDPNGEHTASLLHDAAAGGISGFALHLIDLGVSIHSIRKDGGTLLHSAMEGNLVVLAAHLLDSGLSLDTQNHYMMTARDVAAFNANEQMMHFLEEKTGQTIEPWKSQVYAGSFLGLTPPGTSPEIFGPTRISTSEFDERDITFSSDLQEIYFTRSSGLRQIPMSIFFTEQTEFQWTYPAKASFSSGYAEAEAAITPAGDQLMYISRQPVPNQPETGNWDMWITDLNNEVWGPPRYVGAPFTHGFYPSMATSATVYYTTPGNDIFRSKPVEGNYITSERLPASINTEFEEYNAFISPDENYLIYTRYSQEPQHHGGDLYISFQVRGKWSESINLGEGINSPYHEFCPTVSPDGRYLFFTSNRFGNNDIFWVDAQVISQLRP